MVTANTSNMQMTASSKTTPMSSAYVTADQLREIAEQRSYATPVARQPNIEIARSDIYSKVYGSGVEKGIASEILLNRVTRPETIITRPSVDVMTEQKISRDIYEYNTSPESMRMKEISARQLELKAEVEGYKRRFPYEDVGGVPVFESSKLPEGVNTRIREISEEATALQSEAKRYESNALRGRQLNELQAEYQEFKRQKQASAEGKIREIGLRERELGAIRAEYGTLEAQRRKIDEINLNRRELGEITQQNIPSIQMEYPLQDMLGVGASKTLAGWREALNENIPKPIKRTLAKSASSRIKSEYAISNLEGNERIIQGFLNAIPVTAVKDYARKRQEKTEFLISQQEARLAEGGRGEYLQAYNQPIEYASAKIAQPVAALAGLGLSRINLVSKTPIIGMFATTALDITGITALSKGVVESAEYLEKARLPEEQRILVNTPGFANIERQAFQKGYLGYFDYRREKEGLVASVGEFTKEPSVERGVSVGVGGLKSAYFFTIGSVPGRPFYRDTTSLGQENVIRIEGRRAGYSEAEIEQMVRANRQLFTARSYAEASIGAGASIYSEVRGEQFVNAILAKYPVKATATGKAAFEAGAKSFIPITLAGSTEISAIYSGQTGVSSQAFSYRELGGQIAAYAPLTGLFGAAIIGYAYKPRGGKALSETKANVLQNIGYSIDLYEKFGDVTAERILNGRTRARVTTFTPTQTNVMSNTQTNLQSNAYTQSNVQSNVFTNTFTDVNVGTSTNTMTSTAVNQNVITGVNENVFANVNTNIAAQDNIFTNTNANVNIGVNTNTNTNVNVGVNTNVPVPVITNLKFPFLPLGFGTKRGRAMKGKASKSSFGYIPSLDAVIFGIYSKKQPTKALYSGAEVRPLIGNARLRFPA